MRSTLLLLILWLVGVSAHAEIYKWRDAAGQLHFSDQPPAGNYKTETIEVSPPNTATPPPQFNPQATNPAPKPQQTNTAPPRYKSLRVTSPGKEEAIRSNSGELSMSCVVDPALSHSAGHKVRFIIDSQVVAETDQCSAKTENLSRGEHFIQVEIIDAMGKVLLRSDVQKFFLLRTSIL